MRSVVDIFFVNVIQNRIMPNRCEVKVSYVYLSRCFKCIVTTIVEKKDHTSRKNEKTKTRKKTNISTTTSQRHFRENYIWTDVPDACPWIQSHTRNYDPLLIRRPGYRTLSWFCSPSRADEMMGFDYVFLYLDLTTIYPTSSTLVWNDLHDRLSIRKRELLTIGFMKYEIQKSYLIEWNNSAVTIGHDGNTKLKSDPTCVLFAWRHIKCSWSFYWE